jgi:phosphohistidine phosphatase SixA
MKTLLCLLASLIVASLSAATARAMQPALQTIAAPAAERTSLPSKPIRPDRLLAELRKGGYILYFRHASTDLSRDDVRSQDDDDCANQRPLTDHGRSEARAIGAALRELAIPIGSVLASPRCRTMETAMLAFGRAEKSAAVRGGPARPQQPDRYAALRQLLVTRVKPGANLVIASHGNPFYAVAGKPYLAEGEGAVVRPLGADFEVIARIRVNDWQALGEKKR